MPTPPLSRRSFVQYGTLTVASALTWPARPLRGATGTPTAAAEFDVRKYGAVGDGRNLDSPAIQRAIDAAAAVGGGARVLIPAGHKFVVGTLELKSDIDFHLAGDAELLVSSDPTHYRNRAMLIADKAERLRISGTGNLNGRAREFMTHYDEAGEWWVPKEFRPRIAALTGCRDLEVRDISFSEAPSWGLHLLGCERVLIDGVRIRNLLDVPNCDGIDPDHCRDVEIRNCHIVCGDDAIVIKTTRQGMAYGPSARIYVHDCTIETQDSGLKIGTETTQTIEAVRFERCKILSSCRGLTIQLRDEGDVRDISFSDIEFVSRYHSDPWWGRGEAISFTALPRTSQTKVGKIENVTVRNVTGRAENSIRVEGTPDRRVSHIHFENVNVKLERWTKYRGGIFDNRPTTAAVALEPHGTPGFSIRNADDVTLRSCGITWGENPPDYFSHALETENTTRLQVENFNSRSAHPDRIPAISSSGNQT
ncbi:MAG: glycosyl hydrolase family 28 protein [Opitutus sp.]